MLKTKSKDGLVTDNSLLQAFTAHPASVDESYLEHAGFALRFSGKLFAASMAALVHAVLPFAFEKTAGNAIREMHDRMENRGR